MSGCTQIKCPYWISRNELRNPITRPNYIIWKNASEILDAGALYLYTDSVHQQIRKAKLTVGESVLKEGTKHFYGEPMEGLYGPKRAKKVYFLNAHFKGLISGGWVTGLISLDPALSLWRI